MWYYNVWTTSPFRSFRIIHKSGRSRWRWLAVFKARLAAVILDVSFPRDDLWDELGICWEVRSHEGDHEV